MQKIILYKLVRDSKLTLPNRRVIENNRIRNWCLELFTVTSNSRKFHDTRYCLRQATLALPTEHLSDRVMGKPKTQITIFINSAQFASARFFSRTMTKLNFVIMG